MYTEGFEGLEEAEKESRRSYGHSSEMDRLIRENNKLKESLEKEKFFNKLLDQEIQDLKTNIPNSGRAGYPSEYWSGNRRVSRGAFYTLLFVTLLMAAYIGYGIYYDKKFSYPKSFTNTSASVEAVPNVPESNSQSVNDNAAGAIQSNSNTQPKTDATAQAADDKTTTNTQEPTRTNIPPVVKDSVPNIIGGKKVAAVDKKKTAASRNTDEEYNEEEVDAVINEPIKPTARPAATQANNAETKTAETKPAEPPTQTSNREVIARYKVTSKANFYNNPDENAMRGTFISAGGDKVVGALEDKNGFIYVEYTNDLGFTSKGWLSKKDLTKE